MYMCMCIYDIHVCSCINNTKHFELLSVGGRCFRIAQHIKCVFRVVAVAPSQKQNKAKVHNIIDCHSMFMYFKLLVKYDV